MTASAIYRGAVRHRRFEPAPHAFTHRLHMMYVDLAELPGLLDGRLLASARRPAPIRFRREDYLGPAARPLADAVRDLVLERTGRRPEGPVRLLTHLRTFGHVFNPVSFYYCFDGAGERVDTIVAEITNTPWRERHAYVLPANPGGSPAARHRHRFRKSFHVSPFMPMEIDYDWRFTEPGPRLAIRMENESAEGRKVFDATLSLERVEISTGSLARALLRHPFMGLEILAAIHWHALRLYAKKCPFYPHPRKRLA